MERVLQILMAFVLMSSIVTTAIRGQTVKDVHLSKARRVLQTTPLVDGHNDLLYHFFIAAKRRGDLDAYNIAKQTTGQTDIPRLKQGMVGAQLLTVTSALSF